ncbi:MAG: hydroxypyruvate isomerase, partial [Alphaproteobacteria bacterium]
RVLADQGYTGTIGLEGWASGDSDTALTAFRKAFTI